ncbi:MAG: universal stress protein [Ilumatobacter sp.]|uniref:universal stress protein n=1 Tax=Ilumatobacter sp. TaxID=1967498 RepID=UPI002626E4B9|nr:universal stress protein [Ilumatobacter sp.]MDJ0771709.1 universal stress protein [Ilumatobacter sp.]
MKAHTIVVGYDGSADARKALDVAVDHVADDGVVHVVTAYHELSRSQLMEVMAAMPDEYRQGFDPSATVRGYLRDAELLLDDEGVAHVGHFVDEHPAAAILDLADEVAADLIVMGSRGLGRVQRFLRGSVSARVANHATTSLMIVHHDDADRLEHAGGHGRGTHGTVSAA